MAINTAVQTLSSACIGTKTTTPEFYVPIVSSEPFQATGNTARISVLIRQLTGTGTPTVTMYLDYSMCDGRDWQNWTLSGTSAFTSAGYYKISPGFLNWMPPLLRLRAHLTSGSTDNLAVVDAWVAFSKL